MQILEQEPLRAHTTFRIGGAAKYYAIPTTAEEIKEAISFAKERELPFLTIGRGSNILFADEGYPGVVIEIGKGMEEITIQKDGKVRAQAGVSLSSLASAVARESLTGLEFAGGIPGTLGGAVTMNAGAYGGEIKDGIVSAMVLDQEGNLRTLSKDELELSYRSSVIQKENYIVVEAEFQLEQGDKEEILAHMKELNAQRREKQPLEYPSAGSTFKRPEGYFAGKLIQDAGLRGYRVGDAQVSEKHCGFVVNRGAATAEDVKQLIQDVQTKVMDTFGVRLETEVKIIEY
nr:UDP-N-acetylmuramate dehydrogenase [Eubacterium sp.]